MRRLPWWLLLVGCRAVSHVEEFRPELVAVRPDGIEVEIRTKPGLRVGLGTLHGVDGVLVPPSGKVRFTVPRAQWKGYDGNRLQLAGERRSIWREEYAHADLVLGPLLRSLDRIPEGQDPWFAVVAGGGTYATDSLGVETEGEAKLRSDPDPKGRYSMVIATPGDATLEIGGARYEVEATGLTTVSLPLPALLLGLDARSLTTETPRTRVPVVVRRGDDTTHTSLTLGFVGHGLDDALRKVLLAVETGQGLAAKGAVKPLTVFVPYDSPVRAIGDGSVGEARFVAVEHETVRKGGSCAYTSFFLSRSFEDVEVRLYDARTGKKVASKVFAAPYAECPEVASSKDRLVWRPKLETTMEWAGKQAAGVP